MNQRYNLLDSDLEERLANADRDEQANWLILGPSEDFVGHWEVESLWPGYFFDFEDIIGSYKSVAPAKLHAFFTRAEERGYHVAFLEDPVTILDSFAHLDDPPAFSIASNLKNTVNGFLPWQIIGYNLLIKNEDLPAGMVVWDTGTGKTVFMASAIKHYLSHDDPFDIAFVVVKSNNKIDTQRKLEKLANIESIVVQGTPKQRDAIYDDIKARLEPTVVVLNYEKVRDDIDALIPLVHRKRALFFWDEMSVKLSNPRSQLYKKAKKFLYESFPSKPRTKWSRHWELTATPIVNTPSDQYACIRLIHPALLGTKAEFEAQYVSFHHPISGDAIGFRNLDKLEAKIGHMMHRVSKSDPEVKKMFPEILPPDPQIIIDWSDKHRKIYDRLTGKAQNLFEAGDADFSEDNILSVIQVMQMLCDAPSMISHSAQNRVAFMQALEDEEFPALGGPRGSAVALKLLDGLPGGSIIDDGHTKMEMWKEILFEKHPDEKVITHMTWADYGYPPLTSKLEEWGISYLCYRGTPNQKQTALDTFREDDTRVLLTGDTGADGLDIPQATVGINYNYPWTWLKYTQREGRRDRVNSTEATIYTYDLVMANSVDERKKQIIDKKRGYHEVLFDGRAADFAQSASTTREDLLYVLFG